jgi:hypothetical protein
MSSGISHEGMICFGKDQPTPLPVQALDHATGYIMAAAAVGGLTSRMLSGVGSMTRVSLGARPRCSRGSRYLRLPDRWNSPK